MISREHVRPTCRTCSAVAAWWCPGQWGRRLLCSKWDTGSNPQDPRTEQQFLQHIRCESACLGLWHAAEKTWQACFWDAPTVMSCSMPAMMRSHSSSRLLSPHSPIRGLYISSLISSGVTGIPPPSVSGCGSAPQHKRAFIICLKTLGNVADVLGSKCERDLPSSPIGSTSQGLSFSVSPLSHLEKHSTTNEKKKRGKSAYAFNSH